MRIFGADEFNGKITAINAIPVNYIRDGDICIVKIGYGHLTYDPAIYYYEYFTNDGNDEDLPSIVLPLDNVTSDDGGRWKLKDIYTNKLMADNIVTDNITPKTSGGPITIGDNLTVDENGVIVDGQVTINSELTEPPLIVNSDIMVNNLNAQYVGGRDYSSFLRNDNNQVQLPYGENETDVYFTYPMVSPPHYTIMVDICNIVDTDPSIYSWIITKKENDYFTIRFSGIIDTANYTLHYFVIGENESSTYPPSGGPP